MPNRHKSTGNTDETLLSRYEETQARLQKIRDAGYTVVSICGYGFKKLLCDNPGLQNELCSHAYVKHSPINIRDSLTGVEPRPRKHTTESSRGKKSVIWMLSVCTPTFVSTASSL